MKLNLLITAVFLFLGMGMHAQCNISANINQFPVTCADDQITFMGYATSDCGFSGAYNYTWLAYVDGGNGIQLPIDELTISGSAISGTTFPQFALQLGAFPYVQVCLMVNYVDGDGVQQGEIFVCQSSINFPQPIVVTASIGNNSCGQPTCLAQFMASGGTAPYTYLLSNGAVISPTTWNCFDIPGTYVLTAIDANGCEASTSFNIGSSETINATCETAQPMENGVAMYDTLCTINQEPTACAALNYFQSGWYSFNSENFTHANVAFYSGYGNSASGTTGFNYPSAIEVYQAGADGSCNGAELVLCYVTPSGGISGSADPMCLDLADSLALQPNTTYFIKYMTQWTSWVPVQGMVMLTNEPIAAICGCTDNTSCNYDPDALIPDGSCGWSGCMDPGACNYQQWVSCDNGSCIYGSDINGLIFHDLNGDGIQQTWQPAEPVLSNIGVITIEELGVLIYPDASGQFSLPNIPQATYTVSFEDPNGYWILNTGEPFQVTLPTCNGLKIPLIPASEAMAQISGISTWENTTIHCAVGFTPGIYLYNNGNLPLSGTFTITLDPSLAYDEAPWAGTGAMVVAPTETAPGTLTWNITNQPAGSLYYYQIHILGPGAATTGQSFPFAFSLTLNDINGGVFYTNDWNINPSVTCSYDPNDKQATPAGWTDQHFIESGEELEYRIRSIDSLLPLDVIQNSAAIYFDDNEPVITNTYSHTIFSCGLIPDPNGVDATCEGQPVMLNIFPELDYTETYSWTIDGLDVGNEMLYNFPADEAGNYSIVLNRTNPFCNEYDTLHVEVWAIPGNNLTNLNGVLIAPNGGVSWEWFLNGDALDYNFPEMVPMNSGAYTVITTNEFGCSSLSNEVNVIVENVDEMSAAQLMLYPNPAENKVNVIVPHGYRGVQVINTTGQVMYSDGNAAGVQQIDVSQWAAGVYRIEIPGITGATLVVK